MNNYGYQEIMPSLQRDVVILVSSEAKGDLAGQMGQAHYSYRFAEERLKCVFSALRYTVIDCPLPSYISDVSEIVRGGLPVKNPTFIHFIFRSSENIVKIRGAINIVCFAWEFDVIKSDTLPFEHPFKNQMRMLSICDEVWVASSYAEKILKNYGLHNVYRIPTCEGITPEQPSFLDKDFALYSLSDLPFCPLILNNMIWKEVIKAEISSHKSVMSSFPQVEVALQKGLIFLSIFNPGDKRKNFQEMILGFLSFAQEFPNAVLILKLIVSSSRKDFADVICDELVARLDCKLSIRSSNIFIVTEHLTDEMLSRLYTIADFYLCTSIGEGQNMPLIEAMCHGVIPVSTKNTAMEDYINEENSVVIAEDRLYAYQRNIASDIACREHSVPFASQRHISSALISASKLTPEQRATKRELARESVHCNFSPAVVAKLIDQRISKINEKNKVKTKEKVKELV